MITTRELHARQVAAKAEVRSIVGEYEGALMLPEVEAHAADLEAEIARLDVAIRRSTLADDNARNAPGRSLDGGPGNGRPEVRAFEGVSSPVPEGFGGTILRSQTGERVPALKQDDKLASFLPPSESRASELGLGGFFRAFHHGPQSELERRVLAEASIGTGGASVPTPLSAEFIDLLRARSVAFAAGVRTIPMTSQTLRFARVTADPVGAWRAENAAIAVSDPAFDAVTLTAKSWALIIKVSRELLEDATNFDAELRNVSTRSAALALDGAILYGTGSSNQPLGIANTSGIQTISLGTNGGAYTGWASVLDAALALENANAGSITAMILAPRTARAIAGGVDASGQPLQPPPRLAGIPILSTTSASVTETQGTASNASSILLGDFSQVFVGMRTSLQISVLPERYADVGQIAYCLWLRADVAVAHPAALARIQGITP